MNLTNACKEKKVNVFFSIKNSTTVAMGGGRLLCLFVFLPEVPTLILSGVKVGLELLPLRLMHKENLSVLFSLTILLLHLLVLGIVVLCTVFFGVNGVKGKIRSFKHVSSVEVKKKNIYIN